MKYKNTIDPPALNKLLLSLLGSEMLVTKWWVSPNLAFDNQTPKQVWLSEIDGIAKVCNYVLGMAQK